MSKYVSIRDIAVGAVLAEPILNRYGHLIIPSGTKIEEYHLAFLEKWGITKINVEDEAAPEIDPALLHIAKERVAERSDWKPSNPLEEDMINAAAKYVAQLLSPLKAVHESY